MSALEARIAPAVEALCAGLEWLDDPLEVTMRGLELPWAAARALIELGVPAGTVGALHGRYDLALAQVSLGRSGTFELGGPDRRLILAVREFGTLVDLVALSSSDENEWALLCKMGDFLGGELLARAVAEEWREVRLFATPMDWLRCGMKGVCVLDWSASALSALRGLCETATIVCDAGVGERLRALLAHGGLPRVAEMPAMRRAA